MALRSFIVQSNLTQITPNFTCCVKPPSQSRKMHEKVFLSNVSRRIMMVASMTSVLLAGEAIFNNQVANGFDFRFVAPDQTIEEADDGIRGHAQALLQIKALIESESWGETQKALRQSSSFLKQDIYTIIQNKPGSERPQLRKLYSNLFNNVTRLDYAARNKDASRVWQCYENIVIAVNDILSRI
ncbi:Oxygen-evolving enhancer protein 3-2, chloroplastic [Quillaja saponaria]|uniref:Oxygen-evolving enhancer protein 3-2, chloroplastic n=1 Tax=Quillaja saponaria TaxID=32244 RepID=A0AAD7PRN7_QUISA|nr:Oxygen-evolving enhancer protein 3-2, chloroplastic [Quillaja saponaria]